MQVMLAALAAEVSRDAIGAVVTATVERHVAKAAKAAKGKERRRALDEQVRRILDGVDETVLGLEVQEAFRWASEIHVQGMAGPVDTASVSVSLSFASVSRRFQGASGLADTLDESDLATSRSELPRARGPPAPERPRRSSG